MINQICLVTDNKLLSNDTFLLSVEFPEKPMPGQFVMIHPADGRHDPFLPRPISVFDWESGILRLLIKIVGKGTELLSTITPPKSVRIVGHIGNRFPDCDGTLLLIGGGIGIAPLFYTAKMSTAKEKHFILGFRNKESVVLIDEFSKIGKVTVTTDDGSYGFHGFPHQALLKMIDEKECDFSMLLTCGPIPMMSALHVAAEDGKIENYHSLESRMGCGIGACLGCRVELPGGSFLVCKEGPVFEGKKIFSPN